MKNAAVVLLGLSIVALAFGVHRVCETIAPVVPVVAQFAGDFRQAKDKVDDVNQTGKDVAKAIREFKIFREQEGRRHGSVEGRD